MVHVKMFDSKKSGAQISASYDRSTFQLLIVTTYVRVCLSQGEKNYFNFVALFKEVLQTSLKQS